MAKKNLVDAFGTGAVWNNPNLTVSEAGQTGLSAVNGNKPQPWIVAFLLKWSSVFTVSNRTTNTDETITCTNDGDALRTEGSTTYRVTTFRIQIFRVETAPTIDPDDY